MKPKIIQGSASTFKEFCDSTSLHGYPYIFKTNSIIIKLIWGLVILTLTAIAASFIILNTDEFLHSNVVTTIETSAASLDVSVITFCGFANSF